MTEALALAAVVVLVFLALAWVFRPQEPKSRPVLPPPVDIGDAWRRRQSRRDGR